MWYGIAADSYGDSMSAYKLGQMYLYGTKDTEINKELGNYYCKTAFIQFRDGLKTEITFMNSKMILTICIITVKLILMKHILNTC